jgi:hypothetical protein
VCVTLKWRELRREALSDVRRSVTPATRLITVESTPNPISLRGWEQTLWMLWLLHLKRV